MAPKSKANGTVDAPIEVPAFPAVVGINFGNSYSSIAVLTKEGLAECIANEDGERQIASAIAFQGEEIYIGNQARHQLVKNSQNTITGFRDLLGKKFSEIPQNAKTTSAPVIQHPTEADEPAYTVQILQSAPAPLPASAANSTANSTTATPRSEPTPATRTLTVSEVNTLFIQSLVQSAQDFLGRKVSGAVFSVPVSFDDTQRAALKKAAEAAGVQVLQLLDEPGAASVTVNTNPPIPELNKDRTQLVVDLGASSLSLALLSLRQGLVYALATSSHPDIHGEHLDDALITFFAKEFTKKTKTPLSVAPATDVADKRAEAKLRLAVEHTKRTLSASPGAASCSVESLKDGLDYTGSINRMRFDLLARPVYTKVADAVKALVEGTGVDLHEIDEVVYVGGSTSLPGLDETLAATLREDVVTPFSIGTVVGGGVGDPTTILARGCALQAKLLVSIGESEEDLKVRAAFEKGSEWAKARVVTKSIGVLFPGGEEPGELGGTWVKVIPGETALPARRTVHLEADLGEAGAGKKVALEVWEVKEGVRVEKVKPPKVEYSDDEEEAAEEEDEEEFEEVKHRTVEKETFLTSVELVTQRATKLKGGWRSKIVVQFVVDKDGTLVVSAWEPQEEEDGEVNRITSTVAPA
ncbi:hypothetical protein PLICRDRAFT_46672 [Plicaturopsis crispa FD-325 SS-3]|uniref:Actin-like ATPase domain-containing protein n=1 Tax=Plicaturopsis crispa FD-325 SS-3 TaxID=944288 RepID=A0A0C9T6Z1_PLICR|nr:hypothetical protein PLICRDRAFT_46672 [Plicaturopsis crispa FD-325 SS-3]